MTAAQVRPLPRLDACVHCGFAIQLVTTYLGPAWQHVAGRRHVRTCDPSACTDGLAHLACPAEMSGS